MYINLDVVSKFVVTHELLAIFLFFPDIQGVGTVIEVHLLDANIGQKSMLVDINCPSLWRKLVGHHHSIDDVLIARYHHDHQGNGVKKHEPKKEDAQRASQVRTQILAVTSNVHAGVMAVKVSLHGN